MSDLVYNVWGVVTGTLGLLGLLPLAWIYTQLPSKKLCALERLMKEMEGTFHKALEDGLHTCENDLYKFHSSILSNKLLIDDFGRTVRDLKTMGAELKAWWYGLSRKIAFLHGKVDELHTELIESSSRYRRQLVAEGYANALARYSGARSQERRSSILSYISQNGLSGTRSTSTSSYTQACEIPPDREWYAPPRHMDSPLPIPGHDASYTTRPNSHLHTSLYEEPGHGATSNAGLQGSSSGTLNATQSRDRDPTSSFVSDADLKHLLALALTSSSLCRPQRGKRHRAMRRDVLMRFGKHLFGPDTSFDGLDALSHTRHVQSTGKKAVKGCMRPTQRLPPQGAGEGVTGAADIDEESSVPEPLQDECNTSEWQDE